MTDDNSINLPFMPIAKEKNKVNLSEFLKSVEDRLSVLEFGLSVLQKTVQEMGKRLHESR
jgi:hypothetical protein